LEYDIETHREPDYYDTGDVRDQHRFIGNPCTGSHGRLYAVDFDVDSQRTRAQNTGFIFSDAFVFASFAFQYSNVFIAITIGFMLFFLPGLLIAAGNQFLLYLHDSSND
jgi:hypothetical protein